MLMLTILLALVSTSSVFSQIDQDANESKIVINEVELDPVGTSADNAYEWVEIYNPTRELVDIGNWSISTTSNRILVPSDVTLFPGQYLTFIEYTEWITNTDEMVELYDENELLIDTTPIITDTNNDTMTWQRSRDALDTETDDDWKFMEQTRGYTNSVQNTRSNIEISIETDKELYKPGYPITIQGSISGIDLDNSVFLVQPRVYMTINGENYIHNITLELDDEQKYYTKINPKEIIGQRLGVYDIIVKFARNVSSASFIIDDKQQGTTQVPVIGTHGFAVYTDKISYIAGDTIIILAKTATIFDFEGMEFEIINPNGDIISEGVLFPSDQSHSTALRTIESEIVKDAQFATKFYISPINTVYGVYSIVANYANLEHATSFEINEVIRKDVYISLETDKDTYNIGETVSITGSINKAWVGTFNLEIKQQQSTLATSREDASRVANFNLLDTIKVQPGGIISYDFEIPNSVDKTGRYVVKITEYTLEKTISFNVVENIETIETSTFSIDTDKKVYSLGENIIFSGTLDINDPNSQNSAIVIKIVPKGEPRALGLLIVTTPDTGGNYITDNTINYELYEEGTYTAIASYIDSTRDALLSDSVIVGTYNTKFIYTEPLYTDMTDFEVLETRNLGNTIFSASINSEAYDFGDTVNVTGQASGTSSRVEIDIQNPRGKGQSYSVDVQRDGLFTFDWNVPTIKTDVDTGIYTMVISTDNGSKTIVFSVGRDLDSTSTSTPITINISQDVYQYGEYIMISGRALVNDTVNSYQIPNPIKVKIASSDSPLDHIIEFTVTPDYSGTYSVSEKISQGIYPKGTYIATSTYLVHKIQAIFHVGDIPIGIRTDNIN